MWRLFTLSTQQKLINSLLNSKARFFLKKDGKIANAKSSISILKLFIKRGDRITVLFDGIDEVDTLNAVVDYISDLCD